VKHSNLMIWILSIVVGAYTLIAVTERLGWLRPSNSEWQDFQLKPIGYNRFLLRRLDRPDCEIIIELQGEQSDAPVIGPTKSDFLSEASSGTGSYSYSYAAPRTNLRVLYLGYQRREAKIRATPLGVR
jgi:hypothetical protein